MSDVLPTGWAIVPLARVAQLSFGQSPPSSTYNSTGKGLPFFQGKAEFGDRYPTVEKWCTEPTRIAEEGDILLSVRAPVGPTNIAPLRCGIGRGLASIRPAVSVPTDYILYFLKLIAARLASKGTGTTFGAITKSVVEGIEIPLAPNSEQKRIASKLDELFSRIADGEQALARVQKLVERYRQSVLKAAVTGELTREWRGKRKAAGEPVESGAVLLERILAARRAAWEQAELAKMKAKGKPPANDAWKQKYQEPAPPDTSDLPELPEGWVWASFPQLGEFGRGKSKHRPRNDPRLYGGAYPFLQTGVVRASNGRITSYDTTYNDKGLAQSKLWPKGTICITIAANIAASGILEFDACFPDSVVGLVPCSEIVGEYVEFFIRTERSSLDSYAPATAQKNINLEILEQVAIPLPPLDEQRLVYSKAQEELSKIDEIERSLISGLAQSVALRQAVLKSAFSGQLVPQDPTDEPASVLLERIAAERATLRPLSLGPSPARGEGGKAKRGRKRKDARHPLA